MKLIRHLPAIILCACSLLGADALSAQLACQAEADAACAAQGTTSCNSNGNDCDFGCIVMGQCSEALGQSQNCTDGTACPSGDDGLFCTGVEECQAGSCTSPGDPCQPGETCNENTDMCDPANNCGDGTCDTAGGEDPCNCAQDCPFTADETAACTGGCDDDNDGCTDNADSDCGGTETSCTDNVDNDCDGQTDCNDTDCTGDPACACGDGTCDTAGGEDPCNCATDCPFTADETAACTGGCDDDNDGCTDNADSDCGGTETSCTDNVDNDCDGQMDCSDTDCNGDPACACGDGTCDTAGGENPCNCSADCGPDESPGPETSCGDGVDNDCDGNADTADVDCECFGQPDGTACTDDGNECTQDICSGGVCTHPNETDGTACTDDGNECTQDICQSGACAHPNETAGTACGDQTDDDCLNPDTCDGSGVCQSNDEVDGTACTDDGNQCTQDICQSGACAHPNEADGTACNDGVACTDNDQCTAGACGGTNNNANCNDGVACTGDTCDPADPNADGDGCVFTPDDSVCGDGVACTNDTCDPVNDCQNTPDDGNCDDGFSCTDDTCDINNDCGSTPNNANCPAGEVCDPADPNTDPVTGCVAAPEDCSNGIDDDNDGLVDCQDDECTCPNGTRCKQNNGNCVEDTCDDGVDNDNDGKVDCEDVHCGNRPCDDGASCSSDEVCNRDTRTCEAGTLDHAACDDGIFCDGENRCAPSASDADPNTGCREREPRCTVSSGECTGTADSDCSCDEFNDECDEANCTDSLDNDMDGDIDCLDADCPCPAGSTCNPNTGLCEETACGDGVDNDGDGDIDCADADCASQPCADAFACTDDSNATCNGTTKMCEGSTPVHDRCDDGNFCTGVERCNPSANDADARGCRTQTPPCTIASGDCTGSSDADCGCDEATDTCTEANCDDRVDNDGDNAIDCNDDDCASCPAGTRCVPRGACREDACADGVDNDGNGQTDCDDRACDARPCDDGLACTASDACSFDLQTRIGSCIGVPDDSVCDDGIWCNGRERCRPESGMRDEDGCVDRPDRCTDDGEDCDENNRACVETDCGDGVDNDGDGDTDCADSDCSDQPCDDGFACTTGDTCSSGMCMGTADDSQCSDGASCSADACDPANANADADGCVFTPRHDRCDDGIFCDGRERCVPGANDADNRGCRERPRSAPCTLNGQCVGDSDDDCTCDEFNDECREADCDDGVDNDQDGDIDCLDSDCGCPDGTTCDPNTGACIEADCNDGVDNDDNGQTDCADAACAGQSCNDGFACTTGDACNGNTGLCEGTPDHSICDDGLFCDGRERCVPSANDADNRGCRERPISAPCQDAGEACDEEADVCIEVACDDQTDNDGDGPVDCDDSDCTTDRDGDGFSACAGDCDDTDPNIAPGRAEDCSTPADDNCDGVVNCNDPNCLPDRDGDGQIAEPCGEDCDDEDPDNFLRNTENCTDGQDNDCDGLVDCNDADCGLQSCDDGASCTSNDICVQGVCAGLPDDGVCDDGLFCTGTETCDPTAAGADGDGCISSGDPCGPDEFCSEEQDTCLPGDCEEDSFEPDDACDGARVVTVTTTAQQESHTICPEGDRDRIAVDVVAGEQYTFFTTGDRDTQGTLTNAACTTQLAFNNDCAAGDPNFCIVWVATLTGRVVLTVESGASADVQPKTWTEGQEPAPSDGSGESLRGEELADGTERNRIGRPGEPETAASNHTGDYSLWYVRSTGACTEDSFEQADDVCSTATFITPGPTTATQSHTVCPPGDLDWYRFLGQAGTTYNFATSGGTDTRGEIRSDDCGTILAQASDCSGDPNFCLSFTPSVTAFYTVRVGGQTATTVGDYTFEYSTGEGGGACTVDAAEPDNACGAGTSINPSANEQSMQRSICPAGDRDTFEWFAEAGKVYTFRTEGSTDVRGLIQSSSCGLTFAQASSCGNDTRNFCLSWQAPDSGVKKLRIEGRTGSVTGDYTLFFSESSTCVEDAFEPDGQCGQATSITPDFTAQTQSHTICPGEDIDFVSFLAQQGGVYSFRTTGGTDTAGAITDANCTEFLLKSETCGPNDENLCLEWVAPTSGMFKLGITSTETGAYDLVYQRLDASTVTCMEDPAEDDDVCEQGAAIVPTTAIQTMDRSLCPPDDRDHFTFQAQQGVTYRFRTRGETDTTMNIRDASCNKLVGNDDCGIPNDLNACITWTATASGTFSVRVRGFSRTQTVGDYTFEYSIQP